MTITEYFKRENSLMIVLAVITYSGGTLYLSDQPYITEPADSLVNQAFAPIISRGGLPYFKRSINELFGGRSVRSYGRLELASPFYDAIDLRTLNLRGANISIYITAPQAKFPYDDKILWLTGLLGVSKGNDAQTLSYEITDKQKELENVILPVNTYDASAMPASFPSALDNSPIPLGFGFLRSVPGLLIDNATLDFQFIDGGVVDLNVYDNGILLQTEQIDSVSATSFTDIFGTWGSTEDDEYNGCWLEVSFVGKGNINNEFLKIIDYDGATRTATFDVAPTQSFILKFLNLYQSDSYDSDLDGVVRLIAPNAGLISADFSSAVSYPNIEPLITHLLTTYTDITAPEITIDMPDHGLPSLYIVSLISLADILTEIAKGNMAFWGFDKSGNFYAKNINAPKVTPDHEFSINDFIGRITWTELDDLVWRIHISNYRFWSGVETKFWTGKFSQLFTQELQVTKDANPDASEFTFENFGANKAGLATRALDFFGTERARATAVLPYTGIDIELGQTISITDADAPLNRNAIITKVENLNKRQVRLEFVG